MPTLKVNLYVIVTEIPPLSDDLHPTIELDLVDDPSSHNTENPEIVDEDAVAKPKTVIDIVPNDGYQVCSVPGCGATVKRLWNHLSSKKHSNLTGECCMFRQPNVSI